VFPLILLMPEMSSVMGVPDELRAIKWHANDDIILPLRMKL
jgi:hypothetical protein